MATTMDELRAALDGAGIDHSPAGDTEVLFARSTILYRDNDGRRALALRAGIDEAGSSSTCAPRGRASRRASGALAAARTPNAPQGRFAQENEFPSGAPWNRSRPAPTRTHARLRSVAVQTASVAWPAWNASTALAMSTNAAWGAA